MLLSTTWRLFVLLQEMGIVQDFSDERPAIVYGQLNSICLTAFCRRQHFSFWYGTSAEISFKLLILDEEKISVGTYISTICNILNHRTALTNPAFLLVPRAICPRFAVVLCGFLGIVIWNYDLSLSFAACIFRVMSPGIELAGQNLNNYCIARTIHR